MTCPPIMAALLAAALALPAGPGHADVNRDTFQAHRHDQAGRIIIGDIGSGSVNFFDRQTQRLLRLHDATGRAFRFDGRYTSAGALVLNVALLVPGSCFTDHQTRPIVDLHEPQGWGAALLFSDPIEDLDHRQALIDWFLIYLTPSLAERYQREIGDQPPGSRWITLYRDDLADHGYPICGPGDTVRFGLTGAGE